MPDRSYSEVVNASGRAVITVRSGSQDWTVHQISTELAGAPLGATSDVRKNGNLITIMAAAGDVADGAPPIVLLPQDVVTVSWAGCTPGQVGKATLMYDNGR